MSGLSVTPVQSSAPRLSRSQWRLISAASLGGSLEFYDFIIYGIFAQYIAVQFFPAINTFVSLIMSFSVLALGFLARPVGGVVLSGLGDRFGRRPVFLVSLFCTTIATIFIGLLPTYHSWGLAAPLSLVALRLVQGICIGGELPGALTYAVEAAPERSGLACGVIILCVNAGVLMATLVNLGIQSLLPRAEVASYGWRIAFLIGGLIGCVSFLVRRSLEESPEFLRMHSFAKNPVRELLHDHRAAILTAAGVAAVVGGFNGILYGFVPAYLVRILHFSPSVTALAMTSALLVSSAGLIVAAWAGDFIPRHLVLRVGSGILMLVVIPIWSLIVKNKSNLVVTFSLLSLAFSIVSGIWASVVANLFPTRVRFSGIALSYNISITLLSGFAPLVASTIIERMGAATAPAIYIAACTLVTFVSSFFVQRVGEDAHKLQAGRQKPMRLDRSGVSEAAVQSASTR
jgi:MFS family permease